jgi:hypothetical protein
MGGTWVAPSLGLYGRSARMGWERLLPLGQWDTQWMESD